MAEVEKQWEIVCQRYNTENDYALKIIEANIWRHNRKDYVKAKKCYERALELSKKDEDHLRKQINLLEKKRANKI